MPGGALVTRPLPLLLTMSVNESRAKVAVQVRSLDIVTDTLVNALVQPAPLQSVNDDPGLVCATSVTTVFASSCTGPAAVQPTPQPISPGGLVTIVPAPSPTFWTVSPRSVPVALTTVTSWRRSAVSSNGPPVTRSRTVYVPGLWNA